MSKYQKIAVIGGGAAGCCAAWHLKQREFDVELFEKEPHLGGRTHTWRNDELAINTGAGFFTNFYPLLWELFAELGLARLVVSSDKAITLCDMKQRYFFQISSVASFFRIPWLSLREKLRVIRFTVGLLLRKTQFDLMEPKCLARSDDQSIAEFAKRKLGENVYDHLVRPVIEPYWYFSCEDASAAMWMALQAEAPGAQFYTLRGGMDQIATQLANDIPKYLGAGVLEVLKTTDDRFQIVTEAGEHDGLFDGIVVATQAHHAFRLVSTLPESDVSAFHRAYLGSQNYAANINVWYRLGDIVEADCGFQMLPVGKERHGIAAWTDLGSVNREGLATEDRTVGAYLLHDFSLQLLNEPDDIVAERVWQAVRRFRPQLPKHHPEVVRIIRRRNAIPIPEVGRYRLAADFQKAQQAPVAFAGDYLSTATVEGALRTGRIAADLFCT